MGPVSIRTWIILPRLVANIMFYQELKASRITPPMKNELNIDDLAKLIQHCTEVSDERFDWSGPNLKYNPTDHCSSVIEHLSLFLIDSYLIINLAFPKILVRPGPDWPDLFHCLCCSQHETSELR